MKGITHLWLIGLLLAGGTLSAQPAPADLQAEAEAALVGGNPAKAASLASGLVANQPEAFAPAFLLALALFDIGDFAAAAQAAATAYRNAATPLDKQQSAQLAGNAHFAGGALTRAAFWLRRAANHAESEDAFHQIAGTYQELRVVNPLSFQVGGWIAPTDNINSGAESEVFQLEGLPFDFVLPPDRVALSGLEYGIDATATYRLASTSDQTTTVGVYVLGQSYALSAQSRARAPDLNGGDFAYLAIDLSLTQVRQVFPRLGPTSLGLNGGRVWTGGTPTWDYLTLAFQQGIALRDSASLTLRTAQTRQTSLAGAAPVDLTQLSATYRRPLETGDLLEVRMSGLYSDGGFENIYSELTGEVGYTWDQLTDGLRLTGNVMLGYRTYDTFPTTLDGRRDHFGRLGVEALFTGVSYWGFSPRLSVAATRTVSSAEEYTARSLEARIGVTSSF
jgi:hypothetical protein